MAVQITDENFEQYLAQYTRALESEGEVKGVTIITNPDSIRNTLTLPGVNYDINPISNPNAIARDYVQIPYSELADTLDDMNAVAERVETAVTEANNVNAELDGMTVIITNRKGQERSVNMAFDIYDSYKSIAEMNAHLADIPNGGLASIATDDPTDPDNAKLYQKRSDGTLAYIGDLDQASSEAWADWLNNMKPQIEDATDAANAAADRVDDCIATANQDHTQAVTDHTQAGTDHAQYATDHQTFLTNEAQRQSDFDDAQTERNTTWTSWFSDSLSTGVRKLWNDFWSNINSSWNGFFGTSADDANGVRKIWTTWYSSTQSSWNAFWPAAKNTWESWFGTSSSTGVQGEWADLKSDAEQDHTTASGDHTTAESDHTTASGDHTRADADHELVVADRIRSEQDHSRAEADHRTAESDHTTADSDHTAATTQTTLMEAWNTHLPFVGDGITGDANYWYTYDPVTELYVKGPYAKGDNLDWDSMSEQEKQALANAVLAAIGFDDAPTPGSDRAVKSGSLYNEFSKKQDVLIFATAETCESLVEELT